MKQITLRYINKPITLTLIIILFSNFQVFYLNKTDLFVYYIYIIETNIKFISGVVLSPW